MLALSLYLPFPHAGGSSRQWQQLTFDVETHEELPGRDLPFDA
jgi:surfactin synthase thioesterase subunit